MNLENLSIKKVLRRIYEFNFAKCEVQNRNEFYVSNGVSEFVTTFKKQDIDTGVIVTPSGYQIGLFYSVANGGEIYSSPKYNPDVVSFSFNIYGLKKGKYYRITIPAHSAGSLQMVTKDRNLVVTTDTQDLLINEDLTDVNEYKDYYGLFRAESEEINLFFTIGKIYINNIIIDEIELFEEEQTEDEEELPDTQFDKGKIQLKAYGVFGLKAQFNKLFNGRFVGTTKYTGSGINLYYDRVNDYYLIERDNVNDVLGESFTSANYIVEINLNKTVNKDLFNTYRICMVNAEPSPNTLRQGCISFDFVDYTGNKVKVSDSESRISILIYKIL